MCKNCITLSLFRLKYPLISDLWSTQTVWCCTRNSRFQVLKFWQRWLLVYKALAAQLVQPSCLGLWPADRHCGECYFRCTLYDYSWRQYSAVVAYSYHVHVLTGIIPCLSLFHLPTFPDCPWITWESNPEPAFHSIVIGCAAHVTSFPVPVDSETGMRLSSILSCYSRLLQRARLNYPTCKMYRFWFTD